MALKYIIQINFSKHVNTKILFLSSSLFILNVQLCIVRYYSSFNCIKHFSRFIKTPPPPNPQPYTPLLLPRYHYLSPFIFAITCSRVAPYDHSPGHYLPTSSTSRALY